MGVAPDYTHVTLGHGEWLRQIANEIEIPLTNRYLEVNPANLTEDDHTALIARPGMKRWLAIGDGPIQQNIYYQSGSFGDALFVPSGNNLYRVDTDETVTLIGSALTTDTRDIVSMCATARIGSTPEYLFVVGGGNFEQSVLYVYIEDGFSIGTLTGTPANNDVVKIDTTYYKFTSGSVNTGTPAGTIGSPWLVALTPTPFTNLYNAINLTGTAGTDYSLGTTIHTTAQGIAYTTSTLKVRAITAGTGGDTIATTETGATLAWGHATLQGGGDPYFAEVQVPDGVSVIDVVYLASFVLVIVKQDEQENGRFYWINPGEIIIDPLNFATAEQSPDPIFAARVAGDQLFLFGTDTTEIWYPTGDLNAPFLRTQGIVFDRGIWYGGDTQLRNKIVIIDRSGIVWTIENGQPRRISNNAIEELVREAQRIQLLFDPFG